MTKQHPAYGHILTSDPLPQQNHPLSLHGPVVHVKAVIKKMENDAEGAGAMHQHFLVHQIQVLDIRGADPSLVTDEAFVAIRYGDEEGLSRPIEGLAEGEPIELQGEYIDANHAYPSVGNPGDAVIHFTHHPVGFVVYHGVRYD
jgi:hypothetical protein